jgi:lipid II:glycine glycyltransferase (peptidoglycan interpeptide bridge formation enzyme)
MTTQQPHPDELLDWRTYKQRRVSAHQAIEDKALQAYHEAYEKDGRAVAEQKYFETFKKAYHDRTISLRIPHT